MAERTSVGDGDTYTMPAHGWTCFFCGETFTTVGAAQDHFGEFQLSSRAACRIKVGEERGLVMALRKAEHELASYRSEDSEKDRAMHRMRDEHHRALREAEERGYARGLRDALPRARPLDEYHEDMGNVLWWTFPIEEPPYSGSPLDSDWPGYHTHFTPLRVLEEHA